MSVQLVERFKVAAVINIHIEPLRLRIEPEAIYTYIYVLPRGVLKKESLCVETTKEAINRLEASKWSEN